MENNLLERSRKVMAQGFTGTNSKRETAFIEGIFPTHVVKGQGCYLWDVNGKKYVDFISALGANLLGYGHPLVTETVIGAIRNGVSFSLPHLLEVEVAEMIQSMIPCAEKIRFLKTGNEATLAAVRIARAHIQLKDVKAFRNVSSWGYHGHGDLWTSLTSPALGLGEVHGASTGAGGGLIHIVEPIELDVSSSWKEKLINFTKFGNVSIFDEIITAFRMPKFCVANWWNIQPDIICLGKAIANGFPLSVVAGKKEIMDCGEYFISSTFSGEIASLAACKATLTELQKADMEGFYFYANRFVNKLNEICKEINIHWEGYGTRAQLNLYEEPNAALFIQEMCKAGYIFGRCFFFNFAHLEARIEETTLNIVHDIVGRIHRGEVKLEGKAPQQTFKR